MDEEKAGKNDWPDFMFRPLSGHQTVRI